MIMILDVDVTAEGGITKLIAQEGDTTTLGAKGPVKLKNPPAAKGRSILRTLPSEPYEPSHRRRVHMLSRRMYTFSVSYSTCSDHRVTERMRFPVLAYSSRMKVTLSLL